MDKIFEKIITKENLYQAAYRAACGKRYSRSTANFMYFEEYEIDLLHKELMSGNYRTGQYRLFKIYEPNERDISVAPFRDRVVHHALHDVIEPEIDKKFIYDSYA